MSITDYVLGNDQEELARLKLQHELWRDELLKLWDKSRLRDSARVLDLGCGPGYTSRDILIYNPDCRLTSVDISENFLQYVRAQMENSGLSGRVDTQKSFIEDLRLASGPFDTAFCRWLMIFVQNPRKAIEKVAAHLTPGAEFIIQEYVSYDSMDLVPDYPTAKPVVEAIFKSWKDQGGDPNRGKYLPHLLETCGFRVKLLEPVAKFARPADPLWQWPESFYQSFLPRLEKGGYLSGEQVRAFFSDWEHAKENPGAFFVAPTVINIIAEKL